MKKNPLNPFLLLYKTLSLFQNNIFQYFILTMLFFIPFTACEYIFFNNTKLKTYITSAGSVELYNLICVLLGILGAALFLAYTLSIVGLTDSIYYSKKETVFEVFANAVKKLPKFVLLKVIYVAKIIPWLLLLVLPGIYKFVLYSFAGLIYLVEEKDINESYNQSIRMVRPHWFKHTVNIVFIAVVYAALSSSVFNLLDVFILMLKDAKLARLSIALDILEAQLLFLIGIIPLVFYYIYYKKFDEILKEGNSS